MSSLSRGAFLAAFTLGVFSSPRAVAREPFDLERLVPVPAEAPIPTMDFFRPRLLQNPALNRAGTHMVAQVTIGKDRHDLLIYDLDKKTFKTLSGGRDNDIYEFQWLDDQRLVYSIGTQKMYGLGLMAVDIERPDESYPLVQNLGATLVGIPERDRRRPLTWLRFDFTNAGKDLGVAELRAELKSAGFTNIMAGPITSNSIREIEENNNNHVAKSYPVAPGGIGNRYIADRHGELAFAITGDPKAFLTLQRFVDGAWQKTSVDLEAIDLVGAGDKPGEIIVLAPRSGDKPRALMRMNVASGQLGDVLLQDKRYDLEGVLYRDEISTEVVGISYSRAAPQTVWFDESYRNAQQVIEASFPKQAVRIIDGDKTGRMLIATQSDRQPATYHWVNLATKAAGLIKNSAPWIDPERMQPMNVINFKTQEGRQLDAYVTLPAGASKAKPAPLVVLPHGGPWVRDVWGFNGEVQFLASRGYAVLQPNYRGSTGSDWMFPESDRYEFRKMHDDVTSATKLLVASGYVDPKRIAIMGSSFGAYLALSGVAHEPDLYRCAVTIAGVFDWERMMNARKDSQYYSSGYAYLKRKLGDPKQQSEKYEAISPVRHVDQVRVPVFVSHGKEDHVAEVGESRRLIAELKKHNIPHEVLLVSGEGHGMHYLKNQVELYDRVIAFLDQNMAPGAGAMKVAGAP
jgi:dienelactone hydrolase